MIAQRDSTEDREALVGNVLGDGLPFATISLLQPLHCSAIVVWGETQEAADARADMIVAALNQRQDKV